MPRRTPVLGRQYFVQAVELVDALQAGVDELPRARAVGIDLATLFGGAAAGAVQQALRAAGHRADAAVIRGGQLFDDRGGRFG